MTPPAGQRLVHDWPITAHLDTRGVGVRQRDRQTVRQTDRLETNRHRQVRDRQVIDRQVRDK